MSTADYPVWLAVLPDQRDAARADAGKHPDGRSAIAWDKEAQLWFARPGADLSRLQKWLPDRSIRSSGGGDPQAEFLDALTSGGLVLDGLPVMDGRRHRVPVADGKKGNKDGVYRGFLDGIKPGGWFINYHRAENDKDITRWKSSGGTGEADPVARVHIRAVMRQSQDDFAREQAALYAQQTLKAKTLYDRLPAADPAHGYLVRKGITVAEDVRQTRNGALVVPFRDADGVFRTLQYIPPDGEKYLYKDAPKAGHFRVEGGELRNGEPVLYAEGYATARSLHMVTGHPVVMTIDAGNMETVASVLKDRYPDSPHLFMADVDHAKDINKGVLSANRAAVATGGAVLLPDLTAAEIERGFTDFNDLLLFRGADRLRETLLPDIAQALEQLNYKDVPMAKPDDAQPAPDNLPDAVPEATPARRPGAAKEKADDVLRLRGEGVKPAQIAEQLGIGQTSVYRILKAQQTEKSVPDVSVATQDNADTGSGVTAPVIPRDALPAAVISESGSDDAVPELSADAATEPAVRANSAALNPEDIARAMAFSGQGLSLARVAAEMNLGMTETLSLIRAGSEQETVHLSDAATPGAFTAGSMSQAADDFSADFADIYQRLRALKDEAASLDTNALAMRTGALINERIGLTEMWAMGNDTENARWPSDESEVLEAELRALLEQRPAWTPLPAAAAFGEENAILVGAPRVAPQDEDLPASSGATPPRIDADKLLSRITHDMHPDGKSVVYKLDGEPAFIDRGNRLVMVEGASAHEEKVLAALLKAANHYQGRIELTGSDEFKAFAIGVIVANKLNVSMKNASQQADLDAARRAAGQPVTPAAPVDAVRGDPQTPRAAEAPPLTPAAPPAPVGAAQQTAEPVTASPKPAPKEPAAPRVSAAVHTPAEKAREPVTGKVTACGQAPFRFEADASESTFITLRTKEGSQTFWGKELAGLLRETHLQPGRMVTLQWMGEQPVTVNKPMKDAQGNFTGQYEKVQTRRNQWSLAPVGGTRVQTGAEDMVRLAAVDVNRYTQIQHVVVSRLGLDIHAPPKPADGLYWLKPDGQGSCVAGDPLSAPRPEHNERAGSAVMSAWGDDGRPDLYLVQGDGHYLQGVVRQEGVYQHVLVSLPDSKEAPPMVINLLTPEGAQPIGSGNGINRSNGQPVPREHVVVRLTGDEQQRIAKLDAPADVPAALHARLGYDERYKAEPGWVKEQPAAAPQAAPVTPPRPAQ
ncbi:LPD7 domain-containing protein [Pantoea stewartii]|uniref:LPD7 domain-containing protein n=1 Tax=Pantoea stewartii TaxID=66269 RepID=UPI001FD15A5D|nr:LPD7 domain-containing protein [Pantoea stewartii]